MKKTEQLLKALADKNRLRIIKLLESRKMCVCELAFIIGISQPSISRHLKKLVRAGIIAFEQDRFWTNYYLRLENKRLMRLLSCLKRYFIGDTNERDFEKVKKIKREKICF